MRMAPAGLRQPHGSLLLRGPPDPAAWGLGPQRVLALALPESEGSPMLGWTATGVLKIGELESEVTRLRRAPRTGAWGSEPRSPPPDPPPPAIPTPHHPPPTASDLSARQAGARAGRGRAVVGDAGKGRGRPAPRPPTPGALCIRNRIPHLPPPPPIPAFFSLNPSPSRVFSN